MCTIACPHADELQRLLPDGISISGAWLNQEAKQEATIRLQQMAAASEEGVGPPAHLTAGNSVCCLAAASCEHAALYWNIHLREVSSFHQPALSQE